MLKRIKRSRIGASHLPELNLTPLIDVVLVHLLIFMLTAPVIKNSINVDLPSGNMNESAGSGDDGIYVSIDDSGKIFLNGELVDKTNIITKLKSKLINVKTDSATVNIDCHKNASYGDFAELVDKIKYLGGVKNVVLGTYKA